jgi:hypothetical protein
MRAVSDIRIRKTAIATAPGSVLRGAARWSELARAALAELGDIKADVPLVIGSSNGTADDYESTTWLAAFDIGPSLDGSLWVGQSIPVFSGSCASGLQALWCGVRLIEAGHRDVVVLAVEIAGEASQRNFASLRMLVDRPRTPWQADSEGFVTGEAAVAVWLTRGEENDNRLRLMGPVLSQDLAIGDGLRRVLTPLRNTSPTLLIGQGTGPAEADAVELSAFRDTVDSRVPVDTPWPRYGHTVGASGLLSVALAARWQEGVTASEFIEGTTSDGRPLATSPFDARRVRIACRALIGACAACDVTADATSAMPVMASEYTLPTPPSAIMHPALRQIAADALQHRPAVPPDALLVRLKAPLLPPERGVIGGRILPTAVCEMTPGFVSQLIARGWGLTGGAMTLVGSEATRPLSSAWIAACRQAGGTVRVVDVVTSGDSFEVDWNSA